MPRTVPLRLRHGPFTVYLRSWPSCLDVAPFVQARAASGPVIWLDSARTHPVTGRWSLVGCDPWLTLRADGDWVTLHTSAATQMWRDNPLEILRRVLHQYRAPSCAQPQGRAVGLLGFLSYDLNRFIERLPDPQPSEPTVPDLAWFGMKTVVLIDHLLQRSWLMSVADPHRPSSEAHREAVEVLHHAQEELTGARGIEEVTKSPGHPRPAGYQGRGGQVTSPGVELEATSTQAEFETMVLRALDHIRAGDIFQANVSQRFTAPWRGPAFPLYQSLRRVNPSPFACFLADGDLSVVSCSPERLVRVQAGRVDTRPIAGTRPRGANQTEDALHGLELLLSEKERAEHIMLVDLARNDLGRVCQPGSVAVNELMTLEAYSHVIHIVSDIAGTLRRNTDAVEIIRAVFPGGTITGCPKVRCMELLREFEPVARGLYTGSLGYLGFDGTMDLNIAIRTVVIQGGRLAFHVGAGIVADSDPTREYQETLAKAGALIRALQESGHAESPVHAPAG